MGKFKNVNDLNSQRWSDWIRKQNPTIYKQTLLTVPIYYLTVKKFEIYPTGK